MIFFVLFVILAFDRAIPQYPRYSMFGDPSAGEHDLRIVNASIQDDGEFQCQVGPAYQQKPIRASATITVLSKYPIHERTR